MGGSEELHAKLEWAKNDLAAAQKAAADGVELLRKANEERETTNVEARRLREEGRL